MGRQVSTGQVPLPTVPPTLAVLSMLGKGRREAQVASDNGGGITWLVDWCKTSWTSFRLCSWICFWISHSICSANCWLRPRRGASSTLCVSPLADVEAATLSGSGAVVTITASMAWAACVSKLASLEPPSYPGERILGGIWPAPNLAPPQTPPVLGIH